MRREDKENPAAPEMFPPTEGRGLWVGSINLFSS